MLEIPQISDERVKGFHKTLNIIIYTLCAGIVLLSLFVVLNQFVEIYPPDDPDADLTIYLIVGGFMSIPCVVNALLTPKRITKLGSEKAEELIKLADKGQLDPNQIEPLLMGVISQQIIISAATFEGVAFYLVFVALRTSNILLLSSVPVFVVIILSIKNLMNDYREKIDVMLDSVGRSERAA